MAHQNISPNLMHTSLYHHKLTPVYPFNDLVSTQRNPPVENGTVHLAGQCHFVLLVGQIQHVCDEIIYELKSETN